MKPMTSADIEAKLEVAAAERAELEVQAEELSLAAVSGDTEAVQQLAKLQSRISQIQTDSEILHRAKVRAEQVEHDARQIAHAARCAKHYDLARGHAVKLLENAALMDSLITEFGKLALLLKEHEGAIWTELRLAEQPSTNGFNGRRGISQHANAVVLNVHAQGDFVTKVSISDFARMGWSFLLPASDDDAT